MNRLRLDPESQAAPSTDDDLGRTVIHPPENIDRQEEKEINSVQASFSDEISFD